jgi:hypothetical protein
MAQCETNALETMPKTSLDRFNFEKCNREKLHLSHCRIGHSLNKPVDSQYLTAGMGIDDPRHLCVFLE